MFFVYVVTAVCIYAQYKLGRDDDEQAYRRMLPEIEAELDRENDRLDLEISRLLKKHRKLCAER